MARRGTPAIRRPTWSACSAPTSSSSTPEERPARTPSVFAEVRPWRISRTVVISEEATEPSTVVVPAAQVSQGFRAGRIVGDLDVPDGSADQQAPASVIGRGQKPGAEPGRCVGQHRAPLRVVPSANRERPARRRRQTPAKASASCRCCQPSRFTVKRRRCRRTAADRRARSPRPEAQHLAAPRRRPGRRRGPAGAGGRGYAAQTLTGASIRPRNRRSGVRSPSGVRERVAGVDGHRAKSQHRPEPVRSPRSKRPR